MTRSRRIARSVGTLMLAAFPLYSIGSSIATTASPGPLLVSGVAAMLLNSVAVVAIGVLMLPVLRPHAPKVAAGYLATRIFEGTFLAVGAAALLVGAADIDSFAYNIAMAGLGVGSLFFCAALYRSRLVPRFLAVWGFIGYGALAVGCFLDLAGVAGAGLVSMVPGGLFELVFAIWLIARGFGPTSTNASRGDFAGLDHASGPGEAAPARAGIEPGRGKSSAAMSLETPR
ncbi:DUF4386 domain-containing protein [Arthrobacter sp. CAN_C5]|uniref:DUF4386 domain-containing protein n=1 Tax=Arthrobacter sp. CAN_C5 TaxID=2760706 RepID=UPI001AE6CE6B|nr:DUF4386 domain-containing protein [Arthrobacter sp. CAN_C5]MBP2216999.1 hypothetical protein [Arthrobacter sp. CAN_C5]